MCNIIHALNFDVFIHVPVHTEYFYQRERAEQVVTAATASTTAPVTAAADAEDDTLSYFARLAEE